MALTQNYLKNQFLLVAESNSRLAGATSFAQAYANYALTAQTAGGDHPVAAAIAQGQAAMQQALASIAPTANVNDGAAAIAAAFVLFWQSMTFGTNGLPTSNNVGGDGVFSKVNSSMVLSATGAALQSALAHIAVSSSQDTACGALATAFHAATTQNISVLISGVDTSNPPKPIANTGGLS